MQYYTLAQFRKKANLSVEEADRIAQYIKNKSTTDCIECNGEIYISYNYADAYIKNHAPDVKNKQSSVPLYEKDQGSYSSNRQKSESLMWTCPNDETINTGEYCIICGGRRPANISTNRQVQTNNVVPQKGTDIKTKVVLTLEQAALGCEKRISVRRLNSCPECNGSGYVKQSPNSIYNSCSKCNGKGQLYQTYEFIASIPAGVCEDHMLEMDHFGNIGTNGGPRGKVLVDIEVIPSLTLQRKENDIFSYVPVTAKQAANGDTINFQTLDGTASFKLPKGTKNGDTFSFEGKGVPNISNPRIRGKHIITISVVDGKDKSSKSIIPGVIKGIAGAILLSLVGVPIQFILLKTGYVSAAAGLIPYLCANIGYAWITKGDINAEKWRTVCCILISLIMVGVNSVLAYALLLMQELAKNGWTMSLWESVDYLLNHTAFSELRDDLVVHIALSYFIWGMCAVVSHFRNKGK